MKVQEERRPYQQGARAEAAAENTRRIVAAAQELFAESLYDQVSLADVAARAGVGLQTLIRRFRTKEALVAGIGEIVGGRVEGAVANLVEHYEDAGDMVLRLLAQEDRVDAFRTVTDAGRRMHRDWTVRVFAPLLDGLDRSGRELRLAQLVAICDVYTWKLLRRDQGLSRTRTARALVEMINGLVGGPR
jgi:AcrR family transcriptional regulator